MALPKSGVQAWIDKQADVYRRQFERIDLGFSVGNISNGRVRDQYDDP